jgi:hypothetical protein
VGGDGERRRGEDCPRAHLARRLHEVADGLSGAGEVWPQRVEREGLWRRKGPHQRLRFCAFAADIFGSGRDQAHELFCRAARGVPIDDVPLLRQVGQFEDA